MNIMTRKHIENARELFNAGQFKYLGFDNELAQSKHYEYLSKSLFYLDIEIKTILMPYVAKVESAIKTATNERKLHKGIWKLLDNMLNETFIKEFSHRIGINENTLHSFSKKNNCLKEFILMLNVFRQGRNIIMHGDKRFLGRKYHHLNKKVLKAHPSKSDFFSDDSYTNMFKISDINKEMPGETRENPTILALMIKTISLFNHEKVNRKIFSDIDYKIFTFRSRTNICTNKKLYDWIGLKNNWVKNFNYRNKSNY